MTDYASIISALGTSDLDMDYIKDVHYGNLEKEAKPGDHLMVKMYGDTIWHEGIYYNRKYVIDNMPMGGVDKRKLTSFAPTGHDRLIIVKYKHDSDDELDRSMQRALTLRQFCKANPDDFHSQYDVLLNNCQHFAFMCRTGRCDYISASDVHKCAHALFPPSNVGKFHYYLQA